jgi:hypothetical protein
LLGASALALAGAQAGDAGWYEKSPLGAGVLAELIREGDIATGDDYTTEIGGRYHRIHAKFMAIDCVSCHPDAKFPEDLEDLRPAQFPLTAYPGMVDRGICLGCHRGRGALATPFYPLPGR